MAYTASNVANYLRQYNRDYTGRRTWSKMFGDIDLSKQRSLENLKVDYGEAVGDAYKSAMANQAAINSSNLISGFKSAAVEENQLALEDAYNAYLNNYHSGAQTIEQNAATQIQEVNKELLKQGQNFADYANAHIDYLYDLWDKYEAGEIEGTFFNDARFSNYMKDTFDENGVIATDENGNPIREIIGRSELENLIFTPEGYLTNSGKAFFEQMEYDELLRDNSFSSYLSQANPDLYNWAMSDNPYDYAPNAVDGRSTMAGTFREMTGRESTDEVFTNIEAFYGMTPETLNRRIAEFESKVSPLIEGTVSKSEKTQKESSEVISDEISKLLSDFGLVDVITPEMSKQGYSDIKDYVDALVNSNPDDYSDDAYGEFERMIASFSADYQDKEKQKSETRESIRSSFTNLVADIADYGRKIYDANVQAFSDSESLSGGTITAYDQTISKHQGYYNFMMNDQSKVSFLSSATLGTASNVRDKHGDNFNVKYNGKTYNLEVGKDTMDSKTVEQISKKVKTSMNRSLQKGDVFYHNGKLWVVTEDNTIKNVVNRFASNDYKELISQFNI